MKDFPYGEIVDTPPARFLPPEAWPEYLAVAMPKTICAREEVGVRPRGVRWSLWPLTFEEYVSDEEPDIAGVSHGKLARNRLVMWKRVRRTDTPLGWHTISRRPWRIDGFVELKPQADYRVHWHKQARRDLRLWEERHADKDYMIEPIRIEEYTTAYARSTVYKRVGIDPLSALKRKYDTALGREHMELWGVRNIKTGKIVAGIAPRYSPTHGSASYECPFILPEARGIYAMTALMDHWFKQCQRRGIELLVFNSFWQPGEEKSWKPFSLFKSHFGPRYVAYPPTLWRFVPGKIF